MKSIKKEMPLQEVLAIIQLLTANNINVHLMEAGELMRCLEYKLVHADLGIATQHKDAPILLLNKLKKLINVLSLK